MDRRSFIKKSSIASTAILGSSYLYGNTFLGKSKLNSLNIGVIGTGDRGTGLSSVIRGIDNMEVVASCDVLSFRLKRGLSKAPKSKGYEDYRKLLDNKDVDAVIIATPLNTHSQIAIDALDAGKHVYCEKTLAKGYAGISNLLSKAKKSNNIFQTGHQYHSSRLYTHIVDLINNGFVGEISAIECQWNRNHNWRRPVPEPSLERAINWRMYKEYSGGLTAELCSHQIDFTNWVLGETPTQVMGTGGIQYWKDGRETYDNVHLLFTYPSGIKATFTSIISNAKDGYQIKVLGSKGTLYINSDKAWFYPEGKKNKVIGEVDGVSGATQKWEQGKGYAIDIEHLNPSKQALVDFKESVFNNKQPLSNIVTGAKTAICVQMGLDAMYQNKIIKWNNDLTF